MSLWVAAVILCGLGPRTQPQEVVLRAGAFVIDITPQRFPVSVNGGMRDRMAEDSHDTLHARCLVFDDGRTKLAIAVVDSCMVPRDIVDRARAIASRSTGIPAANMLVSATHTHTAPTLTGVFQSEPDADYRAYLVGRIAEGIRRAAERLEPAEIGWAVGREPGQVFNRRWLLKPDVLYEDPFGRRRDRVKMNPGFNKPDVDRPAGLIDPEVPVVAVRSRDGRPIAALVNYSLHYVGGVSPLSADYFGEFARQFSEKAGAGGDFVAILTNGTSGDINNVDYSLKTRPRRKPFEQIRRVAGVVADVAHEKWKGIAYRRDVTLASAQEEVKLGVRRPAPDEVARARKILAAAQDRALKGYAEIYARETVRMAGYPESVTVRLQAMRIGDVGITAIPCEVFVEIGLELKRRSPLKPSFTIELANGYNGYLPTPEQHALGGYETWRARSSYLEEGASPKVVEALVRLMGIVAR